MSDPLDSKKPEDMTRAELKIMVQRYKPTFASNPYHERLYKLEEEDIIDNNKIQNEIKKKTVDIQKMTIAILIITAIVGIITALGFFK